MFKEQLHNSLDAINPSSELLGRVSEMMAEEAEKPKPRILASAIKVGAMAAAVCLIIGGVTLLVGNSESVGTAETTNIATFKYTEEIIQETTNDITATDSFELPRYSKIQGYKQRAEQLL